MFTFGEPGIKDEEDVVRRGTPHWLSAWILKLCSLFFAVTQPGSKAYQTADILKSLVGAHRMNREINKFAPDVIILSDHGAPGLMLKPNGAKVILVSHHNPARFVALEGLNYSELDTSIALKLEQRVLAKVDAVVCPSHYMQTWFKRTYEFLGLVKVIPNILDGELVDGIEAIDIRAEFNLEQDAMVVFMPSAGNQLKGSQYVIDIVQRLAEKVKPTIGFYIPGDIAPGLARELASLPDRARICLTGQIPYEEHVGNVKSCSFGISPSLIENYSMALLEAVHCGIPMLAFATGGNGDIIRDGENGFLVPGGDVSAMTKKALELLDPHALKSLKRKTTAYSRINLDSKRALNAYLEMINNLCQR